MLWYGPDMPASLGAGNILAAYHAAGALEDRILKPRLWDESRWPGKTGGLLYRALRLSLIDEPLLVFYAVVGQHEFSGHGLRAREAGYDHIRYEFSPPFPYGRGTGTTWFMYPTFRPPPADRNLAMAMGGVEATSVMGRKIRMGWMRNGTMDYHGSLAYLSAVGDLGNYLSQSRESDLDRSPDQSNDMLVYIRALNEKHGDTVRADYRVGIRRIDRMGDVSYLDPFRWFAFWTVFKTRLWSGNSTFALPTLPLGPVRYLPGFGLGLTPWGPEYHFENLAAWDGRVFSLRYRAGDDTFRKSWGLDLEALEAVRFAGWSLDAGANLWRQPRLRLTHEDQGPTPERIGFRESLTLFSPPASDTFPLRAALGQDFKTSGFLPGERLERGHGWRMGLGLVF